MIFLTGITLIGLIYCGHNRFRKPVRSEVMWIAEHNQEGFITLPLLERYFRDVSSDDLGSVIKNLRDSGHIFILNNRDPASSPVNELIFKWRGVRGPRPPGVPGQPQPTQEAEGSGGDLDVDAINQSLLSQTMTLEGTQPRRSGRRGLFS